MGEIKNMKEDALEAKVKELEMELLIGQRQSTKVRSLRLSIARLKTYISQLKKSAGPSSAKAAAKKEKQGPAKPKPEAARPVQRPKPADAVPKEAPKEPEIKKNLNTGKPQ